MGSRSYPRHSSKSRHRLKRDADQIRNADAIGLATDGWDLPPFRSLGFPLTPRPSRSRSHSFVRRDGSSSLRPAGMTARLLHRQKDPNDIALRVDTVADLHLFGLRVPPLWTDGGELDVQQNVRQRFAQTPLRLKSFLNTSFKSSEACSVAPSATPRLICLRCSKKFAVSRSKAAVEFTGISASGSRWSCGFRVCHSLSPGA